MTNREKFKSIFGVEPEQFSNETWDNEYHKLHLYQFVLTDIYSTAWRPKREIARGFVYATNAKDARKFAIQKLGDKYKRYSFSNHPIYALKIQKEVAE